MIYLEFHIVHTMENMTYIIFKNKIAQVAGKEHLKAEPIARMHVGGGATIEEVMEHYQLTRAQVHAVLAYYYENQEELDQAYDEAMNDPRLIQSTDLRKTIESRQKTNPD